MALWGSKLRKTDFDVIKRSRDVTNWERVRGYKKKSIEYILPNNLRKYGAVVQAGPGQSAKAPY